MVNFNNHSYRSSITSTSSSTERSDIADEEILSEIDETISEVAQDTFNAKTEKESKLSISERKLSKQEISTLPENTVAKIVPKSPPAASRRADFAASKSIKRESFPAFVQSHLHEGKRLEERTNALMEKFKACETDEEKAKFKEQHQGEFAELQDQIAHYKKDLAARAASYKDRDGEPLTVADIQKRYKTMKDPLQNKNHTKADLIEYEGYKQISRLYKCQMNAENNLKPLSQKELFDLNFEDEKQCVEFAPLVQAFETQTQNLKGKSLDLAAQKTSVLNREFTGNRTEKDKETLKEIKKQEVLLSDEIDQSIQKLNKICGHVRSKSDKPISKREMGEMLIERTLKKSQTQILTSAEGAAKNLAAGKENLYKMNDDKYRKLTENAIKIELDYQNKLSSLIDEDNDSAMLKNKELLAAKTDLIKAQNKIILYETKLRIGFTKEIYDKEATTDPMKEVKSSKMYVASDPGTIKAMVKDEMVKELEAKKLRLIDESPDYIALQERINKLKQ